MQDISDIAIIGAGPAGLTASIYGTRGGYRTIVLAGAIAGGQLLTTTEIENFPGFEKPISGFDLMNNMINQAKRLGVNIINEELKDIDVFEKPFKLTSSSNTYYSKTVIIATGASAKWLGLESERKFIGKGISSCATCDGFFYKDKTVAVIGGGDTAAGDALFLTKFAQKVYIIHRRDKLRAAYTLQEKLKQNPKIEIIYDSVVEEFIGNNKLEAIKIKNLKNNQIDKLNLSGVFVAIGHTPNTNVFKNKIKIDDDGYIEVNCLYETSIRGIFAAGDVCDKRYKQAIVAAGSGAMAAINAIKYLEIIE